MPDEQLPLLIFAQTARFIAQSATQLGYQTWVADCFADTDTQQVADRLIQLAPIEQLSIESLLSSLEFLTQKQPCLFICGAGIERFYPLLRQLPPHIQPLGNHFQVFKTLRSSQPFFGLLKQLAIPFPETRFTKPTDSNNKHWISKDMQGCGGSHIQTTIESSAHHLVFQEYIKGRSGSVSFIADGNAIGILGFNEQINNSETFRLEQIINQFDISKSLQEKIIQSLEQLVKAIEFKGFGSLDFIVDDSDNIYILELNPRLSASAELYSMNSNILAWHIQASHGSLPKRSTQQAHAVKSLSYVFADKPYQVSEQAQWPLQAHDIPKASQKIQVDEPICTLLIESASTQDANNKRHQLETEIKKNCLFTA